MSLEVNVDNNKLSDVQQIIGKKGYKVEKQIGQVSKGRSWLTSIPRTLKVAVSPIWLSIPTLAGKLRGRFSGNQHKDRCCDCRQVNWPYQIERGNLKINLCLLII